MGTIAQIGKQRVLEPVVPPNVPGVPGFGDDDYYSGGRLRRSRLGLGLFVASIAMIFVGFSSAYVVRRGIPAYDPASGTYSTSWEPLQLPIGILLMNTVPLIAASFAAEVARKHARVAFFSQARSENLKVEPGWIYVSTALAMTFVAGQVLVWQRLHADGHFLVSGAETAFFYVITGTHAFHVLLGIALLAWIAGRTQLWSPGRRYIAADFAAWYLHSMAALWIYLFWFLVLA